MPSMAAKGVRIYRAGLHVNGQLTRHLALTDASSEREGEEEEDILLFFFRPCVCVCRHTQAGGGQRNWVCNEVLTERADCRHF